MGIEMEAAKAQFQQGLANQANERGQFLVNQEEGNEDATRRELEKKKEQKGSAGAKGGKGGKK